MAAVGGEIVKLAAETVAVKVVEEIVKNAPSADEVYRKHPDLMNDDGVILIPGSTSEEPKEESTQAPDPAEKWNEMDKTSDD